MPPTPQPASATAGPPYAGPTVQGRFVISFWGLLAGAALGLGCGVLLQQYSLAPLTTLATLLWAAGGILFGLLVPTIATHAAARSANKRLARRAQAAAGPPSMPAPATPVRPEAPLPPPPQSAHPEQGPREGAP